jgi:hypothetical protein
MKTKHTKGNWTVVYPYGIEGYPGIDAIGKYREGNFSVIILGTKNELSGIQGIDNEEIKANAKLIASAPELLNTLNDLVEKLSPYIYKLGVKKGFSELVALEAAKKAIRKATE